MTVMRGGCQCGAIRFAVEAADLGRASLCHCRMCQKAFGNLFGPLVSAPGLHWTRGSPRYFQSSNRARRGFCPDCGTPLTFEPEGGAIEAAIGAFDQPAEIRPVIQHQIDARPPWFSDLPTLPVRDPEEAGRAQAYYASVVSFQHPDRDD